MKMITYAGLAILGAVFSSTAFAGCGQTTSTNASVMLRQDKALAQQVFGEASEAHASRAQGGNIVGLWLNKVSIGGQEIYQAFESFTSDGMEILNDNGSPLEGNVCLGVWANGTGGTITVYHPSWSYDSNGNLVGTVVITEKITLDPGGSTFKGTFTIDVYDLAGFSIAPQTQGTLSAKRITA